jgi:protein tyrosine phosphatase (PTP) superfamily phosphohydrolase (DUF442 family)
MSDLNAIRNFLQIDQRLATSGMPAPEDFDLIGRAGYGAVINLALPTSDNALANEGELVTRAGMTYVHIPVNFEAPQREDFNRFAAVMDALRDDRVFVHCAKNMRVSAFVFLYRTLRDAKSRPDAERDLKRIWDPDGVWREFVNARLTETGRAPLSEA